MPQQDIVNQLTDRVNDFNRRIRDLEEKVRNINARVNTLDDTLLKKTKSLSDDIQDINDDMEELRDRMANLEVDIQEINREKRKFVTSQELDEIENYMDLMNPINSSFMTEKEVKKLIKDHGDGEGLSRDEIERIVEKKLQKKD
ncbi:MAG: hypothetical protein ABEK00_02050 [Candidatus Nanohaloarchaea archaeon]